MKKFAPSPKQVREAYKRAVDPAEAPQPVTRLAHMTPEKRAEMEKLYGPISVKSAPVVRPPPEKVKLGVDWGKTVEMTDHHPICPACKSVMKLRSGKHGAFYGCTGFPQCKTTWACYSDGRPQGEPRVR